MDKAITPRLIDWYQKNKRDLPWRHTNDPYAIVVSEMMLQQTQVNTVIDYYYRFLSAFPTFEALAKAEEQKVMHLWQGLGYYSRARNLHKLARAVTENHGGQLPKDIDKLKKLPGIGDYMAGAVISIAFDIPAPAVDGNVLRVVARLDALTDDIAAVQTKKKITALINEILPEDNAGDFTQAVMELGATICKPQTPECEKCPLKDVCGAYKHGRVNRIPVKSPKQKPKSVPLFVAVITTPEKLLMEYREGQGLLSRMWGLPVGEDRTHDVLVRLGLSPSDGVEVGAVNHTFTHQKWEMRVIKYSLTSEAEIDYPFDWIDQSKLSTIPIPTAFKKVLRILPEFRDFGI